MFVTSATASQWRPNTLTFPVVLDDFFFRALLATLAVAMVAGPTGCVILWQRKAYFGDTMAHSALLGVVLGMILGLNPEAGVFGVAFLVAVAVVALQRVSRLAGDTILGVLAHSTLAIGLVAMALTEDTRQYELIAYLFGDVLVVDRESLALIGLGGLFSLAVLAVIWRSLVAATLHEGLAAAEGAKPLRKPVALYGLGGRCSGCGHAGRRCSVGYRTDDCSGCGGTDLGSYSGADGTDCRSCRVIFRCIGSVRLPLARYSGWALHRDGSRANIFRVSRVRRSGPAVEPEPGSQA